MSHNPDHGTWAAVVIDVSGTSSALAQQTQPRLDPLSWLQKQRCIQRDVPASWRGRGERPVIPSSSPPRVGVARGRAWGDSALALHKKQPNSSNTHGPEGSWINGHPSRGEGLPQDRVTGPVPRMSIPDHTDKSHSDPSFSPPGTAGAGTCRPAQPTSVPANPDRERR